MGAVHRFDAGRVPAVFGSTEWQSHSRSGSSEGSGMTSGRTARIAIHPMHAALLAACLPLFLGALLSDWAYASTYVVQWTNFASWLLAGALVLVGLALAWAAIDLLRLRLVRDRTRLTYVLVLAATFVFGLVNALVHSRDAWAAMPAGAILSVLVFLLAFVATWMGLATLRGGDAR